MKKIFLAVAVVAAVAMAGVSSAHAGVRISIGLPGPVFYASPRVYVRPAPVFVAPSPVVVAPAPVYAAPVCPPAPVVVAPPVCAPAPVVVAPPVYAPAPVIVAPAPVVRFGFFGPHGHFHRYRYGRW